MRKLNLLALLVSLMPTLALASPTPLRLLESYPSTDVINVGVNGISEKSANGGGAGQLSVSGLTGTVTKAWLYWKGIEYIDVQSGWTAPGNGTYDEPEIHFDNQLITGTLVAANGAVDCHPNAPVPDSGAVYRADVTAIVQARGNFNYPFSGVSDGLDALTTDGAAHSANGLSLIIYYDDGNSANNRRVDHFEGQTSDTEGRWNFAFPLDYIGGAVEVILHVSDGQSIFSDGAAQFSARPGSVAGINELLRYTGGFADGLAKYNGVSVPSMSFGRVQGLWDIRRVPITPLFSRLTRYSTELLQDHAADCVSLQVAQVLSSPLPAALMLSPAAHDFGDVQLQAQSASKSFSVTNLWPYPIEFPSAANWTGSNWYRVMSESCTGQALATGASCTIELACTPPFGDGLAGVAPATNLSPAWRQVSINSIQGKLASKLRCGGIPNAAFSRLEFLPSGCVMNDTLINNMVSPPALIVRNTGSLSSTIMSVAIQNTVNAGFSLLSTTCTAGRVLAANDSCELRLLFQASSVPSTVRATAFVNFSASDSASTRSASTALEARSVAELPGDGETLLKNGFEIGVAQCLD